MYVGVEGVTHPVKVTENRGDQSDMMFEEIEEYKELLWQLKQLLEEECDDPLDDMSQTVQYFCYDSDFLQS